MFVKVGPYLYLVHFEDMSRVDADGLHYPGKLIIYIDSSEVLRRQQAAVMHELLHAVWECVIGRQVAVNEKRTISEEDVVTALAPTLLGVIHDNPELLRFLRRGVK